MFVFRDFRAFRCANGIEMLLEYLFWVFADIFSVLADILGVLGLHGESTGGCPKKQKHDDWLSKFSRFGLHLNGNYKGELFYEL